VFLQRVSVSRCKRVRSKSRQTKAEDAVKSANRPWRFLLIELRAVITSSCKMYKHMYIYIPDKIGIRFVTIIQFGVICNSKSTLVMSVRKVFCAIILKFVG
jgi:hypothetical protein